MSGTIAEFIFSAKGHRTTQAKKLLENILLDDDDDVGECPLQFYGLSCHHNLSSYSISSVVNPKEIWWRNKFEFCSSSSKSPTLAIVIAKHKPIQLRQPEVMDSATSINLFPLLRRGLFCQQQVGNKSHCGFLIQRGFYGQPKENPRY